MHDVCPVIAVWNVCCVCVWKQSTVTGQQMPQSVTYFLSLYLSLSVSLSVQELGSLPTEGSEDDTILFIMIALLSHCSST